jgi:predicted DsbA family dithiol-disulfide isomerase
MKIKLVIDFLDKDSYELVKYIKELSRTKAIDIEIVGYDFRKKNDLNNAYYGLHYTNRFGIGLDYTYKVLEAKYDNNLDINDIEVLADIYEALSYNRFDMIDALIDGDFAGTHEFIQYQLDKEQFKTMINAIIYDNENNKVMFDNKDDIISYITK